MEEFEARLAAAYEAWHASRGRTPERFFELYAEDIELHSILEASLLDERRAGRSSASRAALAYFTAIAEAWEMIEASTEAIVARGDKVVWIGRAAWRNLRTLGTVVRPQGRRLDGARRPRGRLPRDVRQLRHRPRAGVVEGPGPGAG